MGSSTPPLPYPVAQDLSSSVGIVPNVRFNGDPAYVLNQSTQPSCIGDAAGSCKGVKSGTVSGEVKPVKGSSTVRISGKPVIREGDPCTLNGGNCPGIYVTEPAPSGAIAGGQPSASTNPPVKPETPKEESWWGKASPWVHGALGLASFKAALKAFAAALKGERLTQAEMNAIDKAADAIAIPRQAHIDVSPTYGQSAAEAAKDAKDLAGSARRDVEAMLKKIDEYDADGGCKKAYRKAARRVLRKSNDDFARWIADVLKKANGK